MKIHIIRKKKTRKFNVTLNESEIKHICRALNEKTEKLMAENSFDSEMEGYKLNAIIGKLLAILN